MQSIHGGNIYETDHPPLDFSANINFLGMPNAAEQAAHAAISHCIHYPDPQCKTLTKAIGQVENMRPENILCGAGAADLIYRIAYALHPQKALVPAPTFSEYQLALEAAGSKILHYFLPKPAFTLDESILPFIRQVDILFLCNPNNPTGLLIDPILLLEILAEAKKQQVILVIDECFNSFLDQSEQYTAKPHLSSYANVIILKAFTKIYAMAGLRLGYCLSENHRLLQKIASSGPPWHVSIIAQEAGCAALTQQDFIAKTRAALQKERTFLKNGLQQCNPLIHPVYDGKANYLFFYSPDLRLKERLLNEKNILIRDCSNYIGLESGYYRIAVRKRSDNIQLLEELQQISNMGKDFK